MLLVAGLARPLEPLRVAIFMTPDGRSRQRFSLRQAVRFDGLWWREFGRMGCVYGPDWWKRHSPPAIAAGGAVTAS